MYITVQALIIGDLITFGLGTVIGLYVGHRGYVGVGNDINDIKTDVATIKNKVKKI